MKTTHNKSNYKPDKNEHLSKNHCYSLSLPRRTKHPGTDSSHRPSRLLESRRFGTKLIGLFKKAAEAKVYGSEFDVQMTADGIVVVNHDNTIGSTAISRATYEQIKESKLKNGETLPTLQAYLEEGRKLKDLQLILEIKKNKNKEHEDQAVKTIVKMVKDMGMEKQTEYISFSLNVCEQLVKATNGASEIFYINGDLSPQEAKAKRFHRHRL